MVGAVVVKNGTVVGRGYHEAVGGKHAEVNALDDAGDAAREACLYVTLEPCNHTGRTPPCTERIVSAGISRVVAAMADPNPAVKGGGASYLREKGTDVRLGVCEAEALELNEAYVKFVQTGTPFVTMKCAATLDGRIATRTGDSKWISGDASRRYVHELRHGVDAILVGRGTVEADDPSLTARLGDVRGKDPLRIILDEDLSVAGQAKVLRLDSDSGTLIVTGEDADRDRIGCIEELGGQVLRSPLKDDQVDMSWLLERLGGMNIISLLIEGGSRVFASALSAGILDKIVIFYAPKLLGGEDGVPIFRGRGPAMISGSIPVKRSRVQRFGDDFMIEGYL